MMSQTVLKIGAMELDQWEEPPENENENEGNASLDQLMTGPDSRPKDWRTIRSLPRTLLGRRSRSLMFRSHPDELF